VIYARIVSGTVAELFTPPAGVAIADCFNAALAWVDVTAVSPPPQPGWTASETGGVWSFAAPPAPPAPALAQQAAAAISAGIILTLSGSMTLAAIAFPTDPVTQSKLAAIATTINTTGAFPGGATSYPMKDATGTWHTFTLAQYKVVAAAIAAYAASLDLIIDGNPLGAVSLPTASVALTV
jgi:hypothetical protein